MEDFLEGTSSPLSMFRFAVLRRGNIIDSLSSLKILYTNFWPKSLSEKCVNYLRICVEGRK